VARLGIPSGQQGQTFRIDGLEEMAKGLKHTSQDVRPLLKKVNRLWARKLAVIIKAAEPTTGGVGKGRRRRRSDAKKKEGITHRPGATPHNTPHGIIRKSIKTHAGVDYSSVTGGDARTPHFVVSEFGGGVWWRSRHGGAHVPLNATRSHKSHAEQFAKHGASRGGHIIGVRERSGMKDGFPMGHFFFPTVDKNLDKIFKDYWNDMTKKIAEHTGHKLSA